jgi:vanillate O-demethylase ferredoxin subunit
MSLFKVKVSEIIEETSDIKSFRLTRLDGRPFDPYEPGAHIDVVGPTNLVRQYSLVSPAHKADSYIISVKREAGSRGGSAALHELQAGTVLEISQPRNLLRVAADADKHLLVGAGIGVTPLVSIAYHLARAGASFEFHYFARSRQEAAFVELLEQRSGFGDRVHFHFGVARDDQPAVLARTLEGLTPRSHVYTCGPEGFMAKVEALTAPLVGDDHVHIEHFQAAEAVDAGADSAFEIELDTGEVFQVPAGASAVDVLRANGIDVETSCREGICGTCVNGVLEGVPEHRDNCLSTSDRAANDQMALCVSRSRTPRLVIELY